MNLPPPPTQHNSTKIEKEVVIAAEKEAVASMERAKKELESRIGIDPTTKCVHVSASMDGAYRSSSCFSSAVSTTTGKVFAYKVATNSCCSCTRYRNEDIAGGYPIRARPTRLGYSKTSLSGGSFRLRRVAFRN